MSYSLKYNKKLSNSPCLPLMMEGWNELIKIKYVDPLIILNEDTIGDHEVIWMEYKNKPVALITFTCHPDEKYAWIRMTFVEKSHRHQYLYEKMYAKLKKIIIKQGLPRISGGIYSQNKPMQEAAKKVGRIIEYSVWTVFLK